MRRWVTTTESRSLSLPHSKSLPAVATVESQALSRELDRQHRTPCLIVDLDIVRSNYRELSESIDGLEVFYAIKANSHPEVLNALREQGCNFDVASIGEIEQCRAVGATGAQMSFGNTVKSQRSIIAAVEAGIDYFAFDCIEELDKLSEFAPGSLVMCRLQTSGRGAAWPLSRKFGRHEEAAEALLCEAHRRGHRCGVTFHVGSQQLLADGWDESIASSAVLGRALDRIGGALEVLNLGGGFGSRYLSNSAPSVAEYAQGISTALDRNFGTSVPPRLFAEPGRGLVAEAGVIDTEVLLVSSRPDIDPDPWVYVDVGVATGLVETSDSMILFPVSSTASGELRSYVIAGPTCDSVDVLYDRVRPLLPATLKPGDRLRLHHAGAYTSVNSTVGFNGFDPLEVIIASS